MWPHHMQQEEHFQRERLQINHRWDVHHNWGLRRLEFDADAFKSGRLVIRVLQAGCAMARWWTFLTRGGCRSSISTRCCSAKIR